MMKRFSLAILFVCAAASANAQQTGTSYENLPPPKLVPALPSTEAGEYVIPPIAQPGVVPPLPPSRACTANDLYGVWKVLQVYEEPAGPETASFYTTPSQYIRFNPDSTFETYEKESDERIGPESIVEEMKNQKHGLQQYVMQNNGQLYYYRDSVAVKQQACFVVVQSNNTYSEGQILMMPPNTQSPTRWVKIHSKIWVRSLAAAAPANTQKTKKNR